VSLDTIISEDDIKEFEEMELLLAKNPKKGAKFLEQLRAKWGNIPFVCFLELKCIEKEKPTEYLSKLEEYSILYPNYSLFKLSVYASYLLNHKKETNIKMLNFEEIFEDRSSITNFEMFEFQTKKLYGIMAHKNLNELDAIYSAINDLDLSEPYMGYFKTIVLLTRFNFLIGHFNHN
jgi:hypothetical protein